MPLYNFFAINMPYGIIKNNEGQWAAFNREYMPLGWNVESKESIMNFEAWKEHPIFTTYKGFSEVKLANLSWSGESGIQRDSYGKINKVFLYNGSTPSQSHEWENYLERIKVLSTFRVKHQDV